MEVLVGYPLTHILHLWLHMQASHVVIKAALRWAQREGNGTLGKTECQA